MSWDEISESTCQIAGALSLVGDRWTLLIMRELFLGATRFDQIRTQTGMSSHLLTTRLKRMEADGLIERRRYDAKSPRHEYAATAKGKELDAVLLVLRAWGLRWKTSVLGAEPAIELVHRKTREVMGPDWTPPQHSSPFTFDTAEISLHALFSQERDSKLQSFRKMRRRRTKDPS